MSSNQIGLSAKQHQPTSGATSINSALGKQMNPDNQQFAQWLDDVAINRDKPAFAHLFRWFGPKIQRVAKQKLGCEQLAGEVMQETMTNVWRKAHLFKVDKGQATTWIYTIMRNVIFDTLRKIKSKQNECLSEDIYPIADEVLTAEESFKDHLLSKKLAGIVDLLPQPQQQVVKAIYFQEMTHEQLAEQLNIPVGTVKSRLRLALNRLKQHIGSQHD